MIQSFHKLYKKSLQQYYEERPPKKHGNPVTHHKAHHETAKPKNLKLSPPSSGSLSLLGRHSKQQRAIHPSFLNLLAWGLVKNSKDLNMRKQNDDETSLTNTFNAISKLREEIGNLYLDYQQAKRHQRDLDKSHHNQETQTSKGPNNEKHKNLNRIIPNRARKPFLHEYVKNDTDKKKEKVYRQNQQKEKELVESPQEPQHFKDIYISKGPNNENPKKLNRTIPDAPKKSFLHEYVEEEDPQKRKKNVHHQSQQKDKENFRAPKNLQIKKQAEEIVPEETKNLLLIGNKEVLNDAQQKIRYNKIMALKIQEKAKNLAQQRKRMEEKRFSTSKPVAKEPIKTKIDAKKVDFHSKNKPIKKDQIMTKTYGESKKLDKGGKKEASHTKHISRAIPPKKNKLPDPFYYWKSRGLKSIFATPEVPYKPSFLTLTRKIRGSDQLQNIKYTLNAAYKSHKKKNPLNSSIDLEAIPITGIKKDARHPTIETGKQKEGYQAQDTHKNGKLVKPPLPRKKQASSALRRKLQVSTGVQTLSPITKRNSRIENFASRRKPQVSIGVQTVSPITKNFGYQNASWDTLAPIIRPLPRKTQAFFVSRRRDLVSTGVQTLEQVVKRSNSRIKKFDYQKASWDTSGPVIRSYLVKRGSHKAVQTENLSPSLKKNAKDKNKAQKSKPKFLKKN